MSNRQIRKFIFQVCGTDVQLWDGRTAVGNRLLPVGGFSPAPHFFLFKTKKVSRKGERSGYITHEMCLGASCSEVAGFCLAGAKKGSTFCFQFLRGAIWRLCLTKAGEVSESRSPRKKLCSVPPRAACTQAKEREATGRLFVCLF